MENRDTTAEDASFAHEQRAGEDTIVLMGHWTLRGLGDRISVLSRDLEKYARQPDIHWDLTQLAGMDSFGALVLRRIHRNQRPRYCVTRTEHTSLFSRLQDMPVPQSRPKRPPPPLPSTLAIRYMRSAITQATAMLVIIGQFILDIGLILRAPARAPWAQIGVTIYESGARALGITALVGALVGIVMSYLSALQLRSFGAPSLIVDILGIGILRELGPMLAAILVAGRSGSAMTAELGVMSVTEELDALAAMGISRSMRLILPKIIALAITLPLLVAWTDIIGLFSGMITAHFTLGIGIKSFILAIPHRVPVVDLLLGLMKGVVFGAVIALIASHFGLRIKPNTQSLAEETTRSVVTSITMVILVDALFAMMFRNVGLP